MTQRFPGPPSKTTMMVTADGGRVLHPAGLQCYAGTAPVTRRSGKSDFVVARRLAHNHYLGAAVHQWAFCNRNRALATPTAPGASTAVTAA